MMHWSFVGGPGMMSGGWLIAFGIVRILVFALIVYGFVRFSRRKNRLVGYAGALQTLNDRYARGEIDEEEYQKRKDVLTK